MQAAKKPKTESAQGSDNSFAGPSVFQDSCLADPSLPGVSSSNPTFSKAGATFTLPMLGMSLGAAASLDTTDTYNPASHSEWPHSTQSHGGYVPTCIKQEPLGTPLQGPALSLPTSTSSFLQHPSYRTDKTVDFNPVKQENKGPGGSGLGKHQPPPQSAYPQPPPTQPSPVQKLSLDKYKEKYAAELSPAVPKHRLEQHGSVTEGDMRGHSSSSTTTYAPSSVSQVDHRKHSLPHQLIQHAHGGGESNTATPLKIKIPFSSSSGQDRRQHSDKRDKGTGSLKPRQAIPVPGGNSLTDKSGPPSKEQLKMKIKVSSSERHSSSDEGGAANNKSKHSSPLVIKQQQQQRGAEHALYRHHKHGHGQAQPHTHSGNGRGPDGPGGGGGGGAGLVRSPLGLVGLEVTLAPPGSTSSSSSLKRPHTEASHNHHSSSSSSKTSKSSKGGAGAAGTFFSPLFSSLLLFCTAVCLV